MANARTLPDDIRLALDLSISTALQDVLSRPTGGLTLSEAHSAVRTFLNDTMSSIARKHNAAKMRGRQLPNEMWCTIWQELPLSDRFRVTHVCQSWRTLALRCPRVWCYIDFWFNHHAQNCPCARCTRPLESMRTMWTSPKLVSFAISRSLQLKLYLHIGDGDGECRDALWPANNPAIALGQYLRPQAGRIAEIHAELWNGWALPNFIYNLGHLPALQVLSASTSNINLLDVPIVPLTAYLPALRHISLSGGWVSGCGPQVSFPAVIYLRLQFTWCNAFGALVNSCPNLAFLDIDLPDVFLPDEAGCIDALRRFLARIPHVRVSNLSAGVEMKANLLFHCQQRAIFDCVYSEEPSYLGTSIFGDFRDGPTSFSCTTDKGTIVMQAFSNDLRRSLSFPFNPQLEIPPVWYSLSTSSLRSLSVNLLVWYLLTPFPVRLPLVETITVLFPYMGARGHFTYVTSEDDDDDDDDDDSVPEDQFPALRSIIARGPTEGTRMSRSSWNRLLRSLGASRPSVRCELVRLEIIDDIGCRNDLSKVDDEDRSGDSDDSPEGEDDSGADESDAGDEHFSDDSEDGEEDSEQDDAEDTEEDDDDDDGELLSSDDGKTARGYPAAEEEDWETTISDKQGLISTIAFLAAEWP